ncbi:hypothetical protein CSX04_04901 [Burkholderia cepacia]|nr:hypothetical protein CSX04_04901 [Burkholderia cepacia]
MRTAIDDTRIRALEIDAQRVQHACAIVRRHQRRIVAVPVRHQPEHARARAVVVALQRAPAIDRARRADARQQHRQRQVARHLDAIAGLPRHAEHERRMRPDRDALVVAEEGIDDRFRRAIGLAPDQLRIRDAVAERGFAHLDLVERLLQPVQVIAPFALDMPRDDRRHPETACDQDQDGNDDAATEHRDAQIAAEGLKRTLRHDARRGSRPRTMPIRSATPGRNSPWKRWNEFRRCQTGMGASTPNEPFRTRQILLSGYLELDRNSVRENVAFGHIPAARRTLRRATGRKRRRGKRRGRAIKRQPPTEAPLRRRGTSAAVERRQVSSA